MSSVDAAPSPHRPWQVTGPSCSCVGTGERVKTALRHGVLVTQHRDDGSAVPVALVADAKFSMLYWQDADLGTTLMEGYSCAEMRFVQEVLAGADGFDAEGGQPCPTGLEDCTLTLQGNKMVSGPLRLELDTTECRDEMLDGLRVLRCLHSILFTQKLEQHLSEGKR